MDVLIEMYSSRNSISPLGNIGIPDFFNGLYKGDLRVSAYLFAS